MRFLALFALPVLTGCVTADDSANARPVCPATRGWAAWVNVMPGPGATPTLIVTGEAWVPAGATVALAAGAADRMMPPGQRFRLEVERGSGTARWQPVRGEIKSALAQYREVIVGCGEETVARISPVEQVH